MCACRNRHEGGNNGTVLGNPRPLQRPSRRGKVQRSLGASREMVSTTTRAKNKHTGMTKWQPRRVERALAIRWTRAQARVVSCHNAHTTGARAPALSFSLRAPLASSRSATSMSSGTRSTPSQEDVAPNAKCARQRRTTIVEEGQPRQ